MKLYYNKDRDKTVALLEDAAASASAKLKERGYKYIGTVFQVGKDVTDLGLGVSKEARQWYKEEPLALEPMIRSLELSVRRLERLADENGWNDYRSKAVSKTQSTQEKNMDIVSEDGYVYRLNREQLKVIEKEKGPEVMTAIQLLQDGLSYINYAKIGSTMGSNNPEEDYEFGIGCLYEALLELRDGVTPIKRQR